MMDEVDVLTDAQQWRNLCASLGLPPSSHQTVIRGHLEVNLVLKTHLELLVGAYEGVHSRMNELLGAVVGTAAACVGIVLVHIVWRSVFG